MPSFTPQVHDSINPLVAIWLEKLDCPTETVFLGCEDDTQHAMSRPGSPTKRPRYSSDDEPHNEEAAAMGQDTPRAPLLYPLRPSVSNPPTAATLRDTDDVFNGRPTRPMLPPTIPEQGPPSRYSTTTSSNPSSPSRRSRSPVKKVTDMRYFKEPIMFAPLDSKVVLPEGVQGLQQEVQRFSRGRRIFPGNLKVSNIVL